MIFVGKLEVRELSVILFLRVGRAGGEGLEVAGHSLISGIVLKLNRLFGELSVISQLVKIIASNFIPILERQKP